MAISVAAVRLGDIVAAGAAGFDGSLVGRMLPHRRIRGSDDQTRCLAPHPRAANRIRADGVTVVMVEQNAALDLADRAYVLEEGRVALSGAAKDLTREAIAAASFGV